MFATTFLTLAAGIIQMISFVKGKIVATAINHLGSDSTTIYAIDGAKDELFSKIGYSQAPVASVPLANQTANGLSQALVENANLKDALGGTIPPTGIEWESIVEPAERTIDCMADELSINVGLDPGLAAEGAWGTSNVQPSMVAVVHDPALQNIAIVCIVVFSILICISIWLLWKNKKSKL